MVKQALIIAAGMGSRLNTLGPSKPLNTVVGKPLIEHAIHQLAVAGISEVTVVTGYMAEEVEAFLQRLGGPATPRINIVRIRDWSTPNGHSVLAGMATLKEPFVLTMSDHICDPALISRLIAAGVPDNGLRLAVDRTCERSTTDIDDATKVWTDSTENILAIGKQLSRYDAIDTGFFIATPGLGNALQTAIAHGAPGSLSDGVQRLAAQGRALVADIGDCWWIDVDTKAMHELAEQKLSELSPR